MKNSALFTFLLVLASACATTNTTNATTFPEDDSVEIPSWFWKGWVVVNPRERQIYLMSNAVDSSEEPWEAYPLLQSLDVADEFLVPTWATSDLPVSHFKLHPSGAVTAHVHIRGCDIILEVFPSQMENMETKTCSMEACGEIRKVQIDHVLDFGPKDVCKEVLTNQ